MGNDNYIGFYLQLQVRIAKLNFQRLMSDFSRAKIS
jgi:hypothetical protein